MSKDGKNEEKEPKGKSSKVSYKVAIDFYSKDKPKRKFEKGEDVSRFDAERLKSLVERGIVKEVKG